MSVSNSLDPDQAGSFLALIWVKTASKGSKHEMNPLMCKV